MYEEISSLSSTIFTFFNLFFIIPKFSKINMLWCCFKNPREFQVKPTNQPQHLVVKSIRIKGLGSRTLISNQRFFLKGISPILKSFDSGRKPPRHPLNLYTIIYSYFGIYTSPKCKWSINNYLR